MPFSISSLGSYSTDTVFPWMLHRPSDREEDRLGAVRRERGKHCLSVFRPGPIVEGQHHLTFAKEIMSLEVLEAKAWAAGGVDLDHAADPQSVGIALA